MPVMNNDKPCYVFKDDFLPINIYYGNFKVGGWKEFAFEGNNLLVEDTCDYNISMTIEGTTIEIGTSTKGPTNPFVLQSSENFTLFSSNGASLVSSFDIPYTLRKLPDGTCDYIKIDTKARTATLVRHTSEVVLNGSETWGCDYMDASFVRVYSVITSMTNVKCSSARCSHFIYGDYYDVKSNNFSTTPFSSPIIGIVISKSLINSSTDDSKEQVIELFKQWLQDNNVTFQYCLSTPQTTTLSYIDMKQYFDKTSLYTDAEIEPLLKGKLLVRD